MDQSIYNTFFSVILDEPFDRNFDYSYGSLLRFFSYLTVFPHEVYIVYNYFSDCSAVRRGTS